MRDLQKLLLLIGFLLLGASLLKAQNATNPFELIPRLDEEARQLRDTESEEVAEDSLMNPFDLIYDSPRATDFTPYEVDPKVDPIITSDKERFLFFGIGIMVLLFTSGVSLVGSYLNNAFLSFLYDNAFSQYYREQEGRGAAPYFILYLLFFINLGFFIFLLLDYFQVTVPIRSYYLQWAVFSLGAALVFLSKHLILILIRWIFPVESEIRRYIFMIIVFSVVLGALLVPANLLIAYGPQGSETYIIWGTIVAIGIVYTLRSIRALFVANKQLLFHRFHFLLYICTVEIAPVLIIVRLILNQL